MIQPPAFVAFTGVDNTDTVAAMQALSRHYPIEWGVLVDDDQVEKTLFPDADTRASLLAAPSLRYAAHVCGEQARLIANDPARADINLAGFHRLQVNHGFSGSSGTQVENTVRFGRSAGIRTMLQSLADFPDDCRLDWLYDTSFGTGKAASHWPPLSAQGPFCGYSGGINPNNVRSVLDAISAPAEAQYWIDMESGVRTDGKFDIAKCEAVCLAVFG